MSRCASQTWEFIISAIGIDVGVIVHSDKRWSGQRIRVTAGGRKATGGGRWAIGCAMRRGLHVAMPQAVMVGEASAR